MTHHPHLPAFKLVKSLSYANLYLNPEKDILLAKYLKDCVIDLDYAKDLVEHVYPYIINGAYYGITDATAPNINITKEARLYFKTNKSIDASKAHAVVVKELYIRMIISMFIKFDKPVVPTKIFNSFIIAVDYLNRMKSA